MLEKEGSLSGAIVPEWKLELGAKLDLCLPMFASYSTSALKFLSYTKFPKAVGTRSDYSSVGNWAIL